MNRYRRTPAVLAVILSLTGCGTDTTEPTVASADSRPNVAEQPAASPTPDALAQYVEGRRRWVACMREQGYNLPDPDPRGDVDMSSVITRATAKADPRFIAAHVACAKVDPTMPAELRATVPPLTAEQLQNLREYAKCMRANGRPSFPDPRPDGEFPEGDYSGLSAQELAANERAVRICDPVAGGEPPATYDPDEKVQG
jgi:hypothetical protein